MAVKRLRRRWRHITDAQGFTDQGSPDGESTVDVVRALIVGRLCLYDALENYRGAADLGPACARRSSNSCTV
jgi:hypothetical protein